MSRGGAALPREDDNAVSDALPPPSPPSGPGQDPALGSPLGSPLGSTLGSLMAERRRLLNLGYRMLGSVQDAEDVVQETYARWYALSEEGQRAIDAPMAWLTRVASRICLDQLGSARARRERYTGEWLPEPVRHGAGWTSTGVRVRTIRPTGSPSTSRSAWGCWCCSTR